MGNMKRTIGVARGWGIERESNFIMKTIDET
jgi:hypothetical protein